MLIQVLFLILAAVSLFLGVSSGAALIAGICFGLLFGNPFAAKTKQITPLLLQLSVVGMGAGMNLGVIAQVGSQGIGYTAIGILATFAIGELLGNWIKVDRTSTLLVSTGTAICGGSAIAAMSSAIRAKDHEVSVSLVTVFLLNAAALFVFPWLGHKVGLDERQFGLWAALAIHDTSSVVGASMQFGTTALQIATTVKLARTLWIIPVTLLMGTLYTRSSSGKLPLGKIKKPWFILGFLGAAALVTWVPGLQPMGLLVSTGARRALVLTLFLIGCGFNRATLSQVGLKPLLQGFLLWLIVGAGTLGAITLGYIR